MPKAVVVAQTGGPEVMAYTDVERPVPGPGQVLVRLAASGVNYIDTYHRSGLYPRPLPLVLGMEGAGTIEEVGEGVTDSTDLNVGLRVAWAQTPASYAEYAVVEAKDAVPVPDGVDDATAAALLLQGLTAHYLATSTYAIQPDDTVLVHAAAGGVGLLLVQLAKKQGGRVIATVSTEEKAELARGAGADEVIRYTEEDFVARTKELTDGQGVHAVYDGVGKTTFDGGLEVLRPRGTMALFGASSGPVPPFDPQRLNQAGSLFLTRPTLVHYVQTQQELRWRAAELFDGIASGALSVRVGGRYPLAEAQQAHEDLQGRKTTGKLLLLP